MVAAVSAGAAPPPVRGAEVTEVHTRLLRIALAVEDSRAYWDHAVPADRGSSPAERAFEERWFGGKSLERVRFLLSAFGERFGAYPGCLAALRRAGRLDPSARQLLCHFHVQLSDPLYRAFSGSFLVGRRAVRAGTVDRGVVTSWLRTEHRDRWSAATEVQFASKLLSAALEAGLVSKRDPRSLLLPKVPDPVIGYVLYTLRHLRFAGTLLGNPYLASLGLTEGFLDHRLRGVPGVRVHRMGELVDFEWEYPTLEAWAEATL